MDLPAGPFRSSLTELHCDWALAKAALHAGASHALWDQPQLRVLEVCNAFYKPEVDKAAFRAAAAERLPRLQKLVFGSW